MKTSRIPGILLTMAAPLMAAGGATAQTADTDQVAMAADLVCIRCVDTIDINYNAVTTNRILDGSVRTADLGVDAVTSTRIRDREVKTQDIDSYAVTTVKLGQYAVTTSKIINGAVTEAKLAQALRRIGRDAQATDVLRRALEVVPHDDSYYDDILEALGQP
mgnify:CR=1 FL=1